MFLKRKENNFMWDFTFFLLFLVLSACSVQKQYTESYFNKEIVLDGRVNKATLLAHKKTNWFKQNYDKYEVDSVVINKLKPKIEGIHFIVFGGTWCNDTKRELPAFLSLLHQLNVGSNRYDIWMLDLKKESK
jgi:hypothetical protein